MQVAAWGILCGFVLIYAALRLWAQDAIQTAESVYYLGMTVGRQVPAPYCRRRLVPLLVILLSAFTRLDRRQAMRAITATSAPLVVLLSTGLAWKLGAPPWMVVVCLLLLLATDALFIGHLAFAYTPDAPASVFALAAAFVDPWAAAVLLALAAASKEGVFAVGAVFMVLAGWIPWWVPIPGAVVFCAFVLFTKAAPPDQEWLKNPLFAAQWAKRTDQWEWQKALSGLKALPFVAAAVLPLTALAVPALCATVIAWLQTVAAQDRVRLVASAAPWVLPATVVAAPEWVLWPWVVLTVFWPWRKDIV